MRAWPWIIGGIIAGAAMTVARPLWAKTIEGQRIERELAPLFDVAEQKYNLPRGMLSRVAYQESRFRRDIIDGETRSSVGASGLMQFMPATAAEWGVKLDDGSAADDIDGAARYLRYLFVRLGSRWDLALAAYNWGIGNVQRKGVARAPKETREYVAGILGDLKLTQADAWYQSA